MKKNIGKTDKIIRVLAGVLIIIVGAHVNSVWGVLGVIPVISSQIGVCPIYYVLHINTNPETNKRQL